MSRSLLARDSPNISSSNTTCISTTFPSWPLHAIARACWICSVASPGDCAWLGTRRLSRHVPTKQRWCDVGYTCNSRPQAPLVGYGRGVLHHQDVVLLQCGMGPERAAQAVLWLGQHYQLVGVLSVGFAGGLQAELRPGDALLVTHILHTR